jgi:hypothetical protein
MVEVEVEVLVLLVEQTEVVVAQVVLKTLV